MVEIVGKESGVVESVNLPEDVLSRTEDPKNKLLSIERIGLLPGSQARMNMR